LIDASSERFWKAMRKSLGSKRREIPEAARHEIVRIYSEMLNGGGPFGEFSKIFDREDFGYREIRVERPLRLSFQVMPERLEALKAEKSFQKLGPSEQEDLMACFESRLATTAFKNRDAFEKAVGKALKGAGIKIGPPVKKAILSVFSERDEAADICLDSDGGPEADTELRDFELVPLKGDWSDFVAREVTPFVPDAWVDQSYCDERDGEIGRVGYEINFNRYFYKYVPPRPLAEIDAELKQLEAEIADLLKEVAA
jgi:type I restriction enzyme M protein